LKAAGKALDEGKELSEEQMESVGYWALRELMDCDGPDD
jgi:hypothetical protein